ncbi:MAG: MFS transporter [Deltaproteobacteria bacterium]|nr:MFS transporter [Deltaproteobacteria bacterium]
MNKLEKKSRGRSLLSFCAFHFLDDGFADSLYLLLPFIAAELHLSFSQVGLLKGAFSASMSFFQFPLSLLGERVGELTVITGGTFGLAGGFLFLSISYTFSTILFSLIFAKGTAGGQHGLSSSLLSRVFEMSGRRAAMGTYNFSGDMGKVCLPFLVAVMINLWSWRQAIFTLAIGGFVAGAILWSLAEKNNVSLPLPRLKEKRTSKAGGWGIRNRKSFSALLTIGIIDIAARTALLTFLPFLLLQKGIPVAQVGFALTLLFAGGAAGKFACGVLAEWLGIIPMVIGTEVLTTVGILSLHFSSPSVIWVLLPFVGVVLNGTSSVLYATVAEIISPTGRSRGYGLYYAITLGSGAISPMIYGYITDSLGLSFTIMSTALMVLFTIPLSRYLSKDNHS